MPSGLPSLDELQDVDVRDTELGKEWTRVLPLDKELRAYLRWRWLRLGFEWDCVTGKREVAGEKVLEDVKCGGVIYEGMDGCVVAGAGAGGQGGGGGDGSGVEGIVEVRGNALEELVEEKEKVEKKKEKGGKEKQEEEKQEKRKQKPKRQEKEEICRKIK